VPYIADLQLSSIKVSIGGGFTPFTVTVTNPSSKEYLDDLPEGRAQIREQPTADACECVPRILSWIIRIERRTSVSSQWCAHDACPRGRQYAELYGIQAAAYR
jgi:hypothetical protein